MDNKVIEVLENKILELRKKVPIKTFNKNKLAEVEINEFFYQGECVDRIMVVLRANGCEHYKKNGGCSMCSHFNGTMPNAVITNENYKNQWDSVVDGSFLEKPTKDFSLNNFPIVCVYNLGSLLNENEISEDAVRYIFTSLNTFKNIKKVIIESRAEYVKPKILEVIKNCFDGIVEVGIGVESINDTIRQVCHHKGLLDINTVIDAVNCLHDFGFKALAYINFKPILLTEKEAVADAIQTSIDCYNMGFDAISIEPTSLQEYSLANHLNLMGYYRVPWLWSLREVVLGIQNKLNNTDFDIRLGGYFDEEILSGSQGEGFAGRNEIFPHQTSCNCSVCSPKFIEQIKTFNKTYNAKDLQSIEPCPHCYDLWKEIYNSSDSRTIEQRVKDIFGDKFEN